MNNKTSLFNVKTQFRPRMSMIALGMMAAGLGGHAPVYAQSEQLALEEVLVTALRKTESLQDLPVSVNVVDEEQLKNLNIRQLDELQGVIAGLTIEADSISPSSSLRGVRFDSFSGVTSSVAMYLNDAPVSQLQLTQGMFDVGQVEVLRGPQGTVQGISAPSGSISIRTQRPEFNEMSGFIDMTATDTEAHNVRGAINIPLVDDMLAVRIAGTWEENQLREVSSVNGDDSHYEHDAFRGTVRFEPTDNLQFNVMYQELNPSRYEWFQVESASIADRTLPAAAQSLTVGDRKAVSDVAERVDASFDALVFEAGGQFFGQNLKYIYMDQDMRTLRSSPNDVANAVSGTWDNFPDMQGGAQVLDSHVWGTSHELRLSSEERLFGFMDYSLGYFDVEQSSDNGIDNQSYVVVFLPGAFAGVPAVPFIPVAGLIATTPIVSTSSDNEKSWFANLTFHLSDDTALSLGMRDISYDLEGALSVSGRVISSSELSDDETIYSASLKHNFTEDLMAYASYGTAWRKGGRVVGDFSINKSPLQLDLETRDPETSESYELGIKSKWMDDRLRLNAAIFFQSFDDYPYRPGEGVYYANYAFGGFDANGAPIVNPQVGNFNFVGSVPVDVAGFELESTYSISENWWANLLVSYAKGEIQNALIPCNDYLPNDGVQDGSGVAPSFGDIFAAAGADSLTQCRVGYRSNSAPLWTTTLSSEYSMEIAGYDGFVRGLWTVYGSSENDPANALDDVEGYSTLNLYAGIRGTDDKWSVQLFAKNVANEDVVIQTSQNPGSVGYTGVDALTQQPDPALAGSIESSYRGIRTIAPREIGINVTFRF